MDFYCYRGGALEFSVIIGWALLLHGPNGIAKAKLGSPDLIPELMSLFYYIDHIEDVFRTLPIKDIPAMKLGNGFAPYFYGTLDHPLYDDYHEKQSVLDKHGKSRFLPLFLPGGMIFFCPRTCGILQAYATKRRRRRQEKTPASLSAPGHTSGSLIPWDSLILG